MRHDLRTPLSGVQGFSELIRDKLKESKIKNNKIYEYLDNFVVSCRALTNVHNQILHAIKVFGGEIPVLHNKFNIRKLFDRITELNQAKLEEKSIDSELRIHKKLPNYLVGDTRRLAGIIHELLTNAMKYTPQGHIYITVEANDKSGDPDKVILKLEIEDSGIGIPEDKKEEIFSRFSRLNPAYEGKYEGLGLGLSIVKQYVDDLHGEIYVKSEVNKGTIFTCFLPFDRALSDDEVGVISDEAIFFTPEIVSEISPMGRACYRDLNWPEGNDEPKPSSKGNYILLVEDDEICTMVGQNTLRLMGHKVDGAMTGSEALEKALSKHYDLIFMDIGLPDIDGKEVTRKIRVAEKITNVHVPIVALTAHVDTDFKEICIEAGMDAVISKPIAKDQVENVIRAFIPGARKVKPQKPKPPEHILELTGKVLDIDYLKKDLGYDDDLCKELFERAPSALKKYIEDLKTSYLKGDWREVQGHAHKIAGACSYCGAKRLEQASRRLSEDLRRRKHEYADKLYNVVLLEAKEVIEKLEKYNS